MRNKLPLRALNSSGTEIVDVQLLKVPDSSIISGSGILDLSTVAVITGTIDCSTNPNYPAATKGNVYVVSVAGKIGGASGVVTTAGDLIVCLATNAGGTQAQVGTSWDVVNIEGTVTSVSSANAAATVASPTTTPVITIVSAPILTTARAIGGVNFDGSAAINPGVVVNSQSGDYTLVLGDANTAILETGATKTITIPANSGGGSVAFAVGTAITFICTNATGCSIAITTDTMTLANSTTTGTRTLAQNGVCTAVKLTSTTWLISGVGLT